MRPFSFVVFMVLALCVSEFSKAACTVQGAATSYRVTNGSCFQITGIDTSCKQVTDAAGKDLFVPNKTTPEWQAFYLHAPTGVTVATCSGNGYFFSRTLTIDHTKAGASNSVNFPVLFSGTYSYLATIPNGGHVFNSSGFDIIITSDAVGATKLNHEIESYDATTGTVKFWVKVPTVSSAADTVIYLWYGNPAIAATQENKTGTWDANFISVWHLTNGTVLSGSDSTSNNFTALINGQAGNNMATAGLIDGGALFAPASSQYLMSPSFGAPPASVTLSAWIKPNAAGGVVFDETGTGALNSGWHDSQIEVETNNSIKSCMWIGSEKCVTAGSGITYGNWYHVAMRYDSGITTLAGFVDGVLGATSVSTKQNPNTGVLFYAIGGADPTNGGNGTYYSGSVDEVHISKSVRSNDWLLTEFNSQNSPATFYTLGAETVH